MYKGFMLSVLVAFSISLVQAQESIEELIRRAEQGDPEAQYQLGEKYEDGEGVEQSDERAFYWFEKAAEQRHPEAEYRLGGMYYDVNIKGIKRGDDYQKQAFLWFIKAANQGHAGATFMLGVYYEYGVAGIEKNEETALFWYRKSKEYGNEEAEDAIEGLKDKMSKQGSAEAQQNLGRNKPDQIEGNKNQTQETVPVTILSQTNESIEELKARAEKGDPEAKYELGMKYEKGEGVLKNLEKAIYLYDESAKQGNTLARYRLAFIKETSEDHKDDRVAFILYDYAAYEGYAPAQYRSAKMLIEGRGTEKDLIRAYAWLKIATSDESDPEFKTYKETLDELTDLLSSDGRVVDAEKSFQELSEYLKRRNQPFSESENLANQQVSICGSFFSNLINKLKRK